MGELLQVRRTGEALPGGLAADVALTAARLGHRGIAVSRLGQDDAAEAIRAPLERAGVDLSHLQSDPDLPTGRLSIRTIAGRTTRSLDDLAAFDLMQWDFDLEDLARRADVIMFSALGRRHGQARSVVDRTLDFARQSLRVFDLTTRAAGDLERSVYALGLDAAEALVVDREALDTIMPGARSEPVKVAISRLISQHELLFVVELNDAQRLTVHTSEEQVASEATIDEPVRTAALVGLLDAVLDGHAWSRALAIAALVAERTHDDPFEPIARDALDAS